MTSHYSHILLHIYFAVDVLLFCSFYVYAVFYFSVCFVGNKRVHAHYTYPDYSLITISAHWKLKTFFRYNTTPGFFYSKNQPPGGRCILPPSRLDPPLRTEDVCQRRWRYSTAMGNTRHENDGRNSGTGKNHRVGRKAVATRMLFSRSCDFPDPAIRSVVFLQS